MKATSTNKENQEILENKIDALSLLKSNVRFRILLLLIIYRELSLTKLSVLMNKSKGAVHYQLQLLINSEIIRETSRREKVRSNIPAKYYSITDKGWFAYATSESEMVESAKNPNERLKAFRKVINSYKAIYLSLEYYGHLLERYTKYIEKELLRPLEEKNNDLTLTDFNELHNIIYNEQFGGNTIFNTADEYESYNELYKEFIGKVIEMKKSKRNKMKEKKKSILEFMSFHLNLPVKKIIELDKKEE